MIDRAFRVPIAISQEVDGMTLPRNVSFDLIDTKNNVKIFNSEYDTLKGGSVHFHDKRFSWMLPTDPDRNDVMMFPESMVMSI